MSRYRSSLRRGDLRNEALFARRSTNYGTAEFLDEQWRLTDLVPLRRSTYLVIFLAATAAVVGLEALYSVSGRMNAMTTDGRVAAFDLDGEGSLAVWFSSTTLLFAAGAALLVYSVRRFRRDDYHGRYRVWIWAALAFLVMAVDETASLHEGFKEMMTWLTGNRVFGDGSFWWVLAYFFLLGSIGSRLLVDMRECRTSVLVLLISAACFVVAVAAQLGLILPESGERGIMLEEGAEMFGDVFLFLAMLLHARHVVLDAEGLLSVGRRTSLGRRDYDYEEELAETEGWVTVDEDEITVHPPHGARRLERARASQFMHSDPVVDEIISPVSRKLTKQEKKALRRKLERARREREGL